MPPGRTIICGSIRCWRGGLSTYFASQLSGRYPQHRGEIEKAATRLSAELQELDQKYRMELAAVRRRELITFHNAFDLIAHRYGLIIVARLTDIESDPHGGITPGKLFGGHQGDQTIFADGDLFRTGILRARNFLNPT